MFEVNRNEILFRDSCNPAKCAIFPYLRSSAKADSLGHGVRHYYAGIKFAANVWRGRCASIIFILGGICSHQTSNELAKVIFFYFAIIKVHRNL